MSVDVGLTTNAVSLYVSTCRLAMLASAVVNNDDDASEVVVDAEPGISVNHNNNNDAGESGRGGRRCPSLHWTELYRQLSCLRQALTCTHCSRIVTDPVEVSAVPTVACRSCITRCDPSAATSTDVQLRIVVQCYQKLCEFLGSSRTLHGKLGGVSANGDTRTLADLIGEGAALGSIRARPAAERPTDGHHFLLSRLLGAPLVSSAHLRSSEILACNGLQLQQGPSEERATEAATAQRSYSVSMDVDRSTRITIKRKRKSASSSSSSSSSSMSSSSSDSLPLAAYAASGNKRVSNVPDDQVHSVAAKSPASISKGCRCGNATLHPGKLTCCGQRCSCYVDRMACDKCKCRGCKNPLNALDETVEGAKHDVKFGASSASTTSSSSSMSSDSSRLAPSLKPSAIVHPPKTVASRKDNTACRRQTKP